MKLQSKVMLKYSLYTIKIHVLYTSYTSYTVNKNGLSRNTTKIDGITFYVGVLIQQSSRRLILNLTWTKHHPQM